MGDSGRRARSRALAGAFAAVTCFAAGLGSVQAAHGATLPSGFQESIAFSGLTNPTAVRFASDGRVFVAEKSGLIKVFDGLSDPTPTLFADLSTNVYNFWDRGLLGLALHPSFPATPYVYALYTYDAAIGGVAPRWGTPGVLSDPCPAGPTTNGCLVSGRLSRLEASGNVMTGPEHVLIEDWCQQFPSHSVGSLAFGPDGALYASGGDGASFTFVDSGQNGNPCGDPPSQGGALRSQDRRTSGDPVTLDGSIVRVDPITGAALPDNPLAFEQDPNARRIIASGLRNPFRITTRPGTSEVWAGDVGWNDWEELNLVANGGDATVENFGWPCYEGTDQGSGRQGGYDSANLSICENLYGQAGAVTAPYYAYNHAAKVVDAETCPTGSSSVAGLAFYNGTTFPASYNGALFFADYSRDCIWVMQSGADGRPNPATVATFAAGAANPVDLAVSPGGDLFYPDFDGGTIRRIRFGSDPPPPPPPSCPAGQYSAQYYANMTLSGTPATERCEPAIDYDWGGGSPAANVPADQFSARWTGTFTFAAGSYQFTATADDGIRVWVDGTQVIDAWVDQGPTTYQATRSLTAGDHEVKVEYYENGGGAVARLSWQLNQPPPPPPSCPAGQYSAQYFGNMTLSGTPVLERCETAIDYDWGSGGPATGVPADRFSTLWTGTFSFAAGNHQFTATADDGIRVWVDGAPVIDAWVDQGPTTYQATRSLTAGAHEVKVAYYENGGGAVARVSWINTGGGGDTTPPDAPTGLGAAVSGSTVNLTWNAASDNVGVTRYNVHRSTTSGFTPTSGNRIAQPTGTSYADTGRPPGTYHYRVTAEDAAGNVGPPSSQASATVVNNPPTAAIATPSATTTWKVGDVVSFSGSASDPEQGTLPASALSWTLILHHCPSNCHTHTVQSWTGVASGSFTAPDHDYPSHLELRLTATDSGGQTDTDSVELQPQTVALAFATEPSGLQLVVGSASQATPFTRTVIVGSLNSISAPTPQSLGGTPYAFSSWSDGGAQTHNITAPAAPATYRATYAEGSPPEAPTGLAASVTGSTVNLTWNAASDNVGVTRYNVHRSTTSGFTPTSGNRIAQPTGTSYADTGRPPGTYHYRVTAEDAAGNVSAPSSQASATVVNNPPSAAITAPAPTTTWKVGDAISFSGSASDPEQGTLPASALSWTLIQHHCPSTCHTHTVQTWTGVASGSFTAPDHDYPSHLELRLTATDSGGQTDTDSVELQPQTVALTFATEPSGLQLVVGSTSQAHPSQATPFTRTVIVGSTNSISATSPQSQGGKLYVFSSWSDGGAQTHNIVAPETPATYTATYLEVPGVPGLVAAYSFDEANGATVFDSSGTGNHGTISGATRNLAGQYGAALDFDGTNDMVTVPDASSLDLTSGMTLEAWVRPLTTSGWRTALIKEQPGNLVYTLYSSNNDNGRPQGRIRVNESNFFINGSSRLTTSVWAHLAATYDGTNLRLYVNSSLVGTRAASGAMVNSANPLRIGGSSVLGRWFRGRIDEVRVYNRALSATEIQNDRTAPLSQTVAARLVTSAPAAPQDHAAFEQFVAAILRF